MKFMTWSLRRPTTSTFNKYKKLAPNSKWNENNYITVDENAPETWNSGQTGFVRMIENNHEKIHALGMHEFMVCDDGTIANMGFGQVQYPNGYYYYDQSKKVLNKDETEIELPVPTSLRYLMLNYPKIRWSIQILATSNSSGDRVNPLLDKKSNQDNVIRQTRKIVELYKKAGFPIYDIEVDCEKTTTREGDAQKFRDFLVRMKNEACIPTNTKMRVNLFAMTGDFNPAYYGWHDYKTLASGKDKNGKQAIDEFQLMTYDFSWGGSAPGPSTPLWWLEQVLRHVKKSLPPEKTFIGNAGYGRRWPLSERRMGVTFDYKQLMQAQNGMYVHNDGSISSDGKFYFRDQDYIPFAGFNDENSDYQVTYLHVYDKFKASQSTLGKYNGRNSIERPADYVTNYSKTQKPSFKGIKKVVTESKATGRTSIVHTQKISEGLNKPSTFQFQVSQPANWFYHTGDKDSVGNIVPGTAKCVKETGKTGQDGKIEYSFSLPSAGKHKVIALVGFPFFGSDKFTININEKKHTIGNSIPEWYPFYTNPSWHYWDCGTHDLSTGNKITVNLTNGAWIGGFIICDSFDKNLVGGEVIFPSNLQKLKKRSKSKKGKTSEIVDAKFPSSMTLTGEILRRPPRPAIIWEDMFGPHLSGEGFDNNTDLTGFPYYLKANSSSFSNGSGSIEHKVGKKTYCISGLNSVGYSSGVWKVRDDEKDSAHVWSNTKSAYGQIILNKRFSSNIQVEVDARVNSSDTKAKYGVRIISETGKPGQGWIARMNFQTKQIEWIDLQDSKNNRYADMSSSLASGIGNRYTMTVQNLNGKVIISVGKQKYMTVTKKLPTVAYGAYSKDATIKVYRLNISTLDRWEPMEKVEIDVDGKTYSFGEVKRNVPYDEFGYLVYTGLPGNVTEAVRAIPSESEDVNGKPSEVEGRKGTVFETEVKPEDWDLDYRNIPLAKVGSWLGKKTITLRMKDPGIWMKTFYIGDSEGYSVAYNSDRIGFIKTSEMVLDYNCKGIALWTLGQEDPQVFEYISKR